MLTLVASGSVLVDTPPSPVDPQALRRSCSHHNAVYRRNRPRRLIRSGTLSAIPRFLQTPGQSAMDAAESQALLTDHRVPETTADAAVGLAIVGAQTAPLHPRCWGALGYAVACADRAAGQASLLAHRLPVPCNAPPRRCIIYLEPSRTSWLYRQLERFYHQTRLEFGPSEAHQYHPHCSLSGFFAVDETALVASESVLHALHQIATTLGCLLDQPAWRESVTPPSIVGLSRPPYTTDKLNLDLGNTDAFRAIVHQLAQIIHAQPWGCHVRPKPVDHISLVYYNKSVQATTTVTPAQLDRIEHLARSLLLESPHGDQSVQWDVVMYEQVHQSPVLHQPHRFRELQRWHLI
ncbi:hypothetical protein H4R34_002803 [Dimargaris verticillata]|uniref:Uncharacterized protein n=1 Tax=Dimargaris verticillata TaxID=2761393 RepID=A0A9W8B3A9_9FUNG|nr:hypothetical protein H4R34_002803 [Dimargaris verticillata]